MTAREETEVNETHRLIAQIGRGHEVRYYLVNREMTWHDAIALWNVLDEARRNGHMEDVVSFAVRSDLDPDPRWAGATVPTGHVARVVNGYTGSGRTGAVKATRRWAAPLGIHSRAGGWIYRADGSTITQGWASAADWAARMGRIVEVPASGAIPFPRWYAVGRDGDRRRIEARIEAQEEVTA